MKTEKTVSKVLAIALYCIIATNFVLSFIDGTNVIRDYLTLSFHVLIVCYLSLLLWIIQKATK